MPVINFASPKPARRQIIRHPAKLSGAVLWTVGTLLAFFMADAAVFRSGWYLKHLEPTSFTGDTEYRLQWLGRQAPLRIPEVLVVGDSRIAEGFSTTAGAAATGGTVRFWNFGVPGSSPRGWYYAIRDADPGRTRFSAIVLALTRYSDQDDVAASQDRIVDLNISIGRLRLTDCLDFALSFNQAARRGEALSGCMLRGLVLRRDLRRFLAGISRRMRAAGDWRDHGLGVIDSYQGKPEDLNGLSADCAKRTIHFPPGLPPLRTAYIRAAVMPDPAPQTGQLTAYRKLWLGRILDLYKDSSTRIVFIEMPRGPLPVPVAATPPRFLQSIAGRPRVDVLPADTFRDLERPDVFADAAHLNHAGRPIFSTRLAQKIADILKDR